jgi:hypothetical protein
MSMAPPQGSSPVTTTTTTAMAVSSYNSHHYNAHRGPALHTHMKPSAVLAGKPTLIEWGKLRFLIMDAPRVRAGRAPGHGACRRGVKK